MYKRLPNTVLSMCNIFCMELVETNAKARSQKYFRFAGNLYVCVCQQLSWRTGENAVVGIHFFYFKILTFGPLFVWH